MRILLAALAALFSLAFLIPPAAALESVTLQLRRAHSYQFAGYYAARELGYFRDAGLDVTIKASKPNQNIVEEVVSGRSQFGVGTSQLLLARQKGEPVVALAVIFQHSPYILITRDGEGGIQTVHDLAGKRIMVGPHGAELLAYLQREGISLDRITRQEQTFNVHDLINGATDALAGYVGHEPFALRQAGFEYRLFTPRMGGIDFYGDNLFTSEKELQSSPERVKAFRQASLRGWEYAAQHPEEVIRMIREHYSAERSEEALRFDATETIALMKADQVQVGYMYPGRWQHMAGVYAELGMLPADFNMDRFLYNPDPEADQRRLRLYLAITLGLLCVGGGVALLIGRVNRRRLRRSQAELAASENLFQTLTDSSAAGILVLREERFLFVNPAMSTITGFSAEELMGMHALDLFEPESRRKVAGRVTAILRGDLVTGTEYRLLTKDGALRWVQCLSVKVVFQGEPAALSTLVDITDRKLAEERLLDSEMDLKNAQQIGGIGNWRFDTATCQTYWSDEIFRILEIDPTQIDASPARFFELVHPDDRDAAVQSFNALRKKRTPYEFKHRLLMPDGRIKIVRNLGQISVAEFGTPLRLKGILQDITESELAQEKRFLQLFDAAPIPLIWIVKRNGQLIFEYFNRSFKKTYGYTANDVKTLDDFRDLAVSSPDQRARSMARWEETFDNPDRIKGAIQAEEEELVCKNGTHLTVLLTVGRIGEDNWLAAHVDITARKKAEEARENFRRQLEERTQQVEELNRQLACRAEEAESANRAKTAFLNAVSHELRTPMHHIIGFTDLLLGQSQTDKQTVMLRHVRTSADNLLNMLEEIFDLTSLEAGVLSLETVDFAPRDVLQAVEARFSFQAKAKALDLHVTAGEDLPMVNGDPHRLLQILHTFMENAIKFTERGGITVTAAAVSADKTTCLIRFEVRDTGIGITPEVQSRLFSAFVQADGSLTRTFGGLGISLAISRLLARLMEGEVGVDSVADQGSTFWLTARFRLSRRGREEIRVAPGQ